MEVLNRISNLNVICDFTILKFFFYYYSSWKLSQKSMGNEKGGTQTNDWGQDT
jgi:hypothetical protein